MIVLAGLGNPGREHAGQRHNIGFMAVARVAERYGFPTWRKRFDGLAAEGTINGQRVLALLPQTYMNLSGQSVRQALGFYKLSPAELFVCHDELDLAPGRIRVKRGGGAGGHNGLRSLDSHLGPDYWRLRLGIGHPGHRDLVHAYVLHDFATADKEWLGPLLDACAEALPLWLAGQPDRFMNKVTVLTQPAAAAAIAGRP